MDSLTMKMERVSYARILVEVDTSKKFVHQVEFFMPNGVTKKQPVVYEFTPKFCPNYNCFGDMQESCQGNHLPTVPAIATPAAIVKSSATKKVQPAEWTVVQRRNKGDHVITRTNH
ncbi:UNVERIFIED_CONTAM: hypothetical protein Sindi_0045800 [Sesamum indicum]